MGDDSVFQKVSDDDFTLPIYMAKEILKEATGSSVIIDDMQLLLSAKEAGFNLGIQYSFCNGVFVGILVIYGCKSTLNRIIK